jgi:hypothetical protein
VVETASRVEKSCEKVNLEVQAMFLVPVPLLKSSIKEIKQATM